MKTITLSNNVVISDPCYKLDTSCLFTTDKARPGQYSVDIILSDQGDWGKRVAELTAYHIGSMPTTGWSLVSNDIGVDSGQCGIFSREQYRNDDISKSYGLPLVFGKNWSDKIGDDWYQRMCSLTMHKNDGGVSDENFGTSPHGVVSSSGYGDGVYDLYVQMDGEEIIAFNLVFLRDDGEDEDDNEEYDSETYVFDEDDHNYNIDEN